MESLYAEAARIADRAVTRPGRPARFDLDRTIDRLVTSRRWGFPLMIGLFALVFWITITLANIPSAWLSSLLIGTIHPMLQGGAPAIGMPWWLGGLLIDGMYLSAAWVVSVMLPPMAIFFPLFTLLEDFGYLPRVAFNLDNLFKKSGAHGKQSLEHDDGFRLQRRRRCGDAHHRQPARKADRHPDEQLRPVQWALADADPDGHDLHRGAGPALFGGHRLGPGGRGRGGVGRLDHLRFVLGPVALGAARRGVDLQPGAAAVSSAAVLQTIYTSVIDRTLKVLWRAVVFAVPAGAVIWLTANIQIGEVSIAEAMIHALNPLGVLIGLNGVILVAYLFAIPANEIVIPTVLMLTVLVTGVSGVGIGRRRDVPVGQCRHV